uniref:Microfibril-associated glycoprotein 4 n=1 Tax=Culex pipiens TaxID=7175 RepID=A0A8D8F051_CULPI
MLVELLLFLLLSSRASSSEVRNNDKDAPEMSPGRLGYELLLSTLENIQQSILKDAQNCKEYNQKLNSDMEMLQKSVANNKQMLANQKKLLDEIEQHFSRLLGNTSKITEKEKTHINSKEISELNFEALESCRNVSGPAYCDQDYEGGGWTVIQNRFEGKVIFYRGWNDYENGFGHLDGEFWLGLKNIHLLTAAKPHELHVVLEDFEGKRVVAKYSHFVVGSAAEKYSLKSIGTFSGDAGDSLEYSLNSMFSTFDSDNDLYDNNCAEEFSGAWWYKSCHFR